LKAFWVLLDQKRRFFISISRLLFLMVFGSEFGCPGLQKQAFGMEGIAKINFRRNSISYDSRVEFSWFWVALGAIFMAFVALETGLKIDGFSGLPGGTPKFRERTSGVVTFPLSGGRKTTFI
jgi:hypothetical protein